MKKLLIHILIIVGLFFVIDRATGLLLKHLYNLKLKSKEKQLVSALPS